ncbi:Hermansky-Pudlak syndrome 3 protein isoform X2 [Notolabrus celidotus]|uniref:Hermansky-Pudlak syndrome 3 protein isoform X2 n=1 Tax=Notolabrus celidotus TaxID=1203425 RepID=UPI00148F7BF4|nr:Hermansky-Pudlak syndrome 3 protein isoform X2 [Notolabrus celidotus]
MVHVYNCHPYSSQQIVQVEKEPGLVCCGGGALFVVATGGCKVEAYSVVQEGCPLICRFATMGTVRNIQHSKIGDYLVTIEEKNSATYLRAYTNWRYQAEEKARVGVRLLGHLLRGASVRGGVQMEIIEIPLSERPVAVACCSVTGDLLVGCENTLVLFTLRRQNQQSLQNQSQQIVQSTWPNTQQSTSQSQGQTSSSNQTISILDFERSVILHLPIIKPKQVSLCGGFVGVRTEHEVLVLKLDASTESQTLDESTDTIDPPEDQADFLVLSIHQELLGDRAKECDIPVSIEKTGLEDRGQYTLKYVLFRRFSPDYFQGCSEEETHLHSLQLYPLFTSNQSASLEEPACVFCFFSLPTAGYLYSLKGGVELLSAYQYPEKVMEAVLTDHLLHVITKNALQCFTVRLAAVAARIEDPYIDTTMKACPPSNLEVCALRMQLFIGLRSLCVYRRHVILLSTADAETPEETERYAQRRGLTRKWALSSSKGISATGHGWNIYVIDTVSPLSLYQEMIEYSQRYAESNPQAQSLRHLLSEAHLLLRASLLHTPEQLQDSEDYLVVSLQRDGPAERRPAAQTESEELEEALRQNCAQLGDCFSSSQKDCHLALPYYRMSGLPVTEVIARNRPLPCSPHSYGPGFLFYLKHYLLEETEQSLSQETADEVIDIFSQSEPSQLISVCASPPMTNISPARTLQILQNLEDTAGVSVPLTITMATMMLLMDDLLQYTQLMERHAEMLLVYGFIEEPRILVHGGCGGQHAHIRPTALTHQLAKSHPGLLVAAMVALHENNKVQLEQADHIFKELGCENCLQVDFWEAMLMASSQEAVIQELLFRLASVYIDRLSNTQSDTYSEPSHTFPRRRPLKNADDLINSCSHYGALYPWLTVLNPVHTTSFQHQEALHKLQSLLCGPSLSVDSIVPLLEPLSEETLWGFSLHLLCATRRGQYGSGIEKLLDRCPQAIIAYANHQLQDKNMVLWWQKLLPELCNRTRASADNSILLAALKETLVVVAMETSPAQFLELMPDDGTASYFLPYLLTCSQRHLMA